MMTYLTLSFAALVYLGIWCIRSHADDCARDPGKMEVKPGTLKVLD